MLVCTTPATVASSRERCSNVCLRLQLWRAGLFPKGSSSVAAQ